MKGRFSVPKTAVLVLLTAALVGYSSTSALGRDHRAHPGRAVLKDCVAHQGEITKRHSLGALLAARRSMPQDVATYTFCPGGIRSAIAALAGPSGTNTPDAIVADCLTDADFALTHRYSLAALRRARHSLPSVVRRNTDCGRAIGSQINTLNAR
jgi:hypothetical protein